MPEAALRWAQHAWAQAGQEAKPAKGHPFCGLQDPRLRSVQFQMHRFQRGRNDLPQFPKTPFVIAEREEIIRVAQVGTVFFCFSDLMIQSIQIEIPPDLTGEIADRQAAAVGSIRCMVAIYNHPAKPQYRRAANDGRQLTH